MAVRMHTWQLRCSWQLGRVCVGRYVLQRRQKLRQTSPQEADVWICTYRYPHIFLTQPSSHFHNPATPIHTELTMLLVLVSPSSWAFPCLLGLVSSSSGTMSHLWVCCLKGSHRCWLTCNMEQEGKGACA
jgi:hypothetical protein